MSKLSRLIFKKKKISKFIPRLVLSDEKKFDPKQVDIGEKIEKEHRKTIEKLKKNPKIPSTEIERDIALDHLKENPKYYVNECPIVEKEHLLIPASRIRRLRNYLIAKDIQIQEKAKKVKAYLRLVRSQEGQSPSLENIFSVPLSSLITRKLQESIVSNPKVIIDEIEKEKINDWSFLDKLFKGDKTTQLAILNIVRRINLSPLDFIKLFKDNRYDILETMVDIDRRLKRVIDRENYLKNLKKEIETEQIEKFKKGGGKDLKKTYEYYFPGSKKRKPVKDLFKIKVNSCPICGDVLESDGYCNTCGDVTVFTFKNK